jgi:AcrR family transcriptional regulator
MSLCDMTIAGDVTNCHHYTGGMGRWEPGASVRLRAAAMDLYVEQGFEQTTVAEIAERAGVTSRTFFRYFSDKREVLFEGSATLQQNLVTALENAPESASPMDAIWVVLDIAAEMLGQHHDFSQLRQTVIVANPELMERELIKMAKISSALADGLRRRGVLEPAASLAAEVGIAILRVAFERWVSGPRNRKLATAMRESFDQIKTLTWAD